MTAKMRECKLNKLSNYLIMKEEGKLLDCLHCEKKKIFTYCEPETFKV